MIIKETRVYEVDDNIGQLILELNQKGYITTFCCGGHPHGTYIAFDRCTSLILDSLNDIVLHGRSIYNHPDNWIVDRWEDQPNMYYKNFIIRRRFTEEEYLMNTDQQLSDIVVNELSDWVDSLPYRNNDNYYEILKL